MRKQLDLTGTVEEDIIVAEGLEAVLQPVDVGVEFFERVEDAAVGTEARVVVGHDGLERHEVAHVHGRPVRRVFVGRVEVHDRAFPADRTHELLHAIAVRRFARAGGPYDELCERHIVVEEREGGEEEGRGGLGDRRVAWESACVVRGCMRGGWNGGRL